MSQQTTSSLTERMQVNRSWLNQEPESSCFYFENGSDLQSSSVSCGARALSGHVVTGRSILALALLLAPVSIRPRSAVGLAAPASVTWAADASSGDGVAKRSVLALTPVAAVWTPVAAITGWEQRGRTSRHLWEKQEAKALLCIASKHQLKAV